MVPGEDADDDAADVEDGGVHDVHGGDALEADEGLDDEDDAHDPGHDGDVDVYHGSEDVGRGLRLHGEEDAVDDEDDYHDDHTAAAGVEAELKGLGHRVGAVVARDAVQLADGEDEDEDAEGLAPVRPSGRQAEAEGGLGAAYGARARDHFTEHDEADEDCAEFFFAYEEGVYVVARLGAGAENPADGCGHDYVADYQNEL